MNMTSIISINHKIIAINIALIILSITIFIGMIILLMKLNISNNNVTLLTISNNLNYYSLLTLHGLVMIFYLIIPIIITFLGNLYIPLMISNMELNYYRLNNISINIFLISFLILIIIHNLIYNVITGWTIYPPLSTNINVIYYISINKLLISLNIINV